MFTRIQVHLNCNTEMLSRWGLVNRVLPVHIPRGQRKVMSLRRCCSRLPFWNCCHGARSCHLLPLGGEGRGGKPIVLVLPVLCPLQVTTFVSLTNASAEHHFPTAKPSCRVPRALARVRFTIFHWDFVHIGSQTALTISCFSGIRTKPYNRSSKNVNCYMLMESCARLMRLLAINGVCQR